MPQSIGPEWPWYMTIAAMRQYMRIAGYGGSAEETNPNFTAAERELGAHCAAAHLTSQKTASGVQIYRTGRVTVGRSGRKTRLQFSVAPAPRAEGGKPQLVSIADKDGGRQRRGGM
jgi:hypothetical protein